MFSESRETLETRALTHGSPIKHQHSRGEGEREKRLCLSVCLRECYPLHFYMKDLFCFCDWGHRDGLREESLWGSVVELGACWMVIRTEQQNPIIPVSQSAEHTKSRRSRIHKHTGSSGGYESALFAVDWRQWCAPQIRFARSPRTVKITITHPPRPPRKHTHAKTRPKRPALKQWTQISKCHVVLELTRIHSGRRHFRNQNQ